jgi:uncharacterized Zn ribbon protein
MSFRANLLKVSLVILLMIAGCKDNPTEPVTPSSSIKGTVLRAADTTRIQGAKVQDQSKNGGTAFTDSVGAFTLPLGVLSSKYSTTLITTATGYIDDTTTTSVEVGKDQFVTIRLKQDNGVLPTSPGATGQAASIDLVLQSDKSLSVRNAGGTEKSLLTFSVKDSLGYLISLQRKVMVRFTIIGGRVGGEFLLPDSIETNANGLASTVVTSGTKSRVLQVVASATVLGTTISSSPAQLTISGGMPDSVRSTMWTSSTNFPGIGGFADLLGTVSVMLVDQYGNPVQPGNLTYFETTGGSIDAIGITDATGLAKVNIYGGGKPPIAGIDTIKVTVNKTNGSFSKHISVTFSGTPQIRVTNVPNDSINIFDGSGQTLDLIINDANGNPLAAGNKISIITGGLAGSGVKLSGDVGASTPDTRSTSLTSYKIRVDDGTANGGDSGPFTLQLMVSGPNGTTSKFIYGTLQPPQAISTPNPDVKKAAQIAYIGTSSGDIYISGVGALENAVITYEVRDSLGMPIASYPRYGATFNINFYPNSFVGGGTVPHVIPSADSTDDQGKLRASIVSGSQAGVVELVARIVLASGKIINSQPVRITVHAGFPDQNHFTLMPSRFVFPSMDYLYTPYTQFTVAVGDTFSNPVPEGTAVYFHSQAGIIQTGQQDFIAYTDKSGLASVGLLTVNPEPDALPYYDPIALGGRIGGHWVWAQTQSRDGSKIIDSVLVIWNKAPILVGFEGHIPSIDPQLDSMLTMPAHRWSRDITMKVTDVNGNPLCDGTTITVAIKFPPSVNGLSFDLAGSFSIEHPITIPNAAYARYPGNKITDFHFQVIDNSIAILDGMVTVNLTITAPGIQQVQYSIPVRVY